MPSQKNEASVPAREQASQLAREAERLMNRKEYAEALCRFDEALLVGLDAQADRQLLAWIHAHRGLAWLQLGIAREAVRAFNVALHFNPGYTRALAYRGEALRCYVRDNLPALEEKGLHWAYLADILADFQAAARADGSDRNEWLVAHHGAAWALVQFTAQHVPVVFTTANVELSAQEELFPIRVRSSVPDIIALTEKARSAPSEFADNAERYFARATELQPSYSWAYAFWAFSLTLRSTRQDHFYEEAKQKLVLAKKTGARLDALASQGLYKLLAYKGDYADSLDLAVQALNFNPQDPFAAYFIATNLLHIAETQRDQPEGVSWRHMARDAVAVARKRLETMRLMVQLMELGLDLHQPPVGAPTDGPLEGRDQMLKSILGRRDPEAVSLLKNDPSLARLHGEPRFQTLWEELHRSTPKPPPAAQ